jgi:hypothetical protein
VIQCAAREYLTGRKGDRNSSPNMYMAPPPPFPMEYLNI